MRQRISAALIFLFCIASSMYAVESGKLQIHFMDVGQGDGAVLISPGGQVVLFDDGALKNCDKPVAYLQQLGIAKVDYHIASHYHSDHIGCAKEVLGEFPVTKTAYDRGGSYRSSAFDRYTSVIGSHRQTATPNTKIVLDSSSANPVEIDIVALNGNGIETINENDLSVVAVVHFGAFKAEIGGDLSGYKNTSYEDIETSVAKLVGPIQVYKVHHHCSRYSTNDAWLKTTKPQVAIVSVGDGNDYGHPTDECLERLHQAGVKTYWTEKGNGAAPEPGSDVVAGTVVVEVGAGAADFVVRPQSGAAATFPIAPGASPVPGTVNPELKYVWSKRSSVYHYANCRYAQTISPENLVTGDAPPPGKTLHKDCPR